jgi:anti-sigma regulatory factor (Ser/Thr protein kinase)
MNARLLLVALEREPDIVLVRKRTRRLAELLGFDRQDQTRITTAVSELARNAFEYAGGGRAEFRSRNDAAAHVFEIIISDKGPGIADLDAVLTGSQPSEKGMGVGLRGARRLMDAFHIEAELGLGTTVRVGKFLPARAPTVNRASPPSRGGALAYPEARPDRPADRWNRA